MCALLLCIFMAGCSSQDNPSYILATGNNSGSYFLYGGSLCKVLSAHMRRVTVSPMITGGAVANARLLQAGEADFAMMQSDVALAAVEGSGMFAQEPCGDIEAIASLYPEVLYIVTNSRTGIRSLSDLKARRVSLGEAGSSVEACAMTLLQACGMTRSDIQAQNRTIQDSYAALQNGELDAAFFLAGTPNEAYEEMSDLAAISLIGLGEAEAAALMEEYPQFQKTVIPAGTYTGITEDISTVSVMSLLVCRKGLSDDFVYSITKNLFENLEELAGEHALAASLSVESAQQNVTIPLHGGAQKYYAEAAAAQGKQD